MSEPVSKLPELYAKLHTVKGEMGAAIKSSNNPFFKSKYADLNAYLDVIEPLLQKNGLVLTQPTIASGARNAVLSRITDVDGGAQIESSFMLPENNDMQKLGSAITYARRYTLGALLGMKAEDDDGNKAVGKKRKKSTAGSDF